MLLGASYLSAEGTVKDRQGSLADLQGEIARLPVHHSTAATISAADQELAVERTGRLAALSTALSTRVRWDRLFREVSAVLPDDVWLAQLSASAPTPATAAAATTAAPTAPPVTGSASTFSIQGHTYSQESVARFLIRLQLVPDLENVTLASSALATGQTQTTYDFTVTADVKPPEAGS
jgi:Tfp pilus assembly protein PilN